MKILSYAPSVELYVSHRGKDGTKYYDLSEDIVSCSVNRMTENPSTFSADFLNPGGKYNNLFEPMDTVVVFTNKCGVRTRLITGYITTVTRFQLFNGNFHMEGKDALYRLQQLYFDPGLVYYSGLFAQSFNGSESWGGYAMDIARWLINVGNWPADQIGVGDLPTTVVDWARGMYSAQREDVEGLASMEQEFYDVLKSSGGQLSSTSGAGTSNEILAAGDAGKVVELYLSWLGKFAYSQAGGRMDPLSSGYSDCSASIAVAYKMATGLVVGTYTGDMKDYGTLIAESRSGSQPCPIDKMVPGDVILVNHRSWNPTYDHIALYIGNNQIADHGSGRGPKIQPQSAEEYCRTRHSWMVRRYVQ